MAQAAGQNTIEVPTNPSQAGARIVRIPQSQRPSRGKIILYVLAGAAVVVIGGYLFYFFFPATFLSTKAQIVAFLESALSNAFVLAMGYIKDVAVALNNALGLILPHLEEIALALQGIMHKLRALSGVAETLPILAAGAAMVAGGATATATPY